MTIERARASAGLAALLLLSSLLYIRAGLTQAYFAADDFQWLAAGHTFTGLRSVALPSGDRFYRPVIELWFAAASAGCGYSTACYHLASLTVHLVNVALVYALALGLMGDVRAAWLATLIFALEPAYTQAVVWVSAITGLLSATACLGSLYAQVRSWRASARAGRTARELLAVVFFLMALFSHEAAITLPIVSWLMWRLFAPRLDERPLVLQVGLTGAVAAFAVATVLANRHNALFTESNYRVGAHMIRHAFDYFVGLYVGPAWWLAYVFCAAGIAGLLVLNRASRFGALWLLVTVLPYLGFTAGNVSRYIYLPSIGFAWAVAAAIVAGSDALGARAGRRVAAAILLVVTLFVGIRFGRFYSASIRGHIEWMEEWRAYAGRLAREGAAPMNGIVQVGPPKDDRFLVIYIEPMLRWIKQDYRLRVEIVPP